MLLSDIEKLFSVYSQLNFTGVTVDPECKYVHFPSNKHMFAPVPVGVASHPKQVYELYNGGAVPVMYQLDLTALEYIQEVFQSYYSELMKLQVFLLIQSYYSDLPVNEVTSILVQSSYSDLQYQLMKLQVFLSSLIFLFCPSIHYNGFYII